MWEEVLLFFVPFWSQNANSTQVHKSPYGPLVYEWDRITDRWTNRKTDRCIKTLQFMVTFQAKSIKKHIVAAFWGMHVACEIYMYKKMQLCITAKKVWLPLPDRRTDRRRSKWSLCAAILRMRHKKEEIWPSTSHDKSPHNTRKWNLRDNTKMLPKALITQRFWTNLGRVGQLE